jgi:hypothetical protein
VANAPPKLTYSRAPLVEVALSVQFDTPARLTQAHLGAYWASQKERFPVVHSAQGLPAMNEEFAGGRSWLPPALRLALSEEPDTRVQMTSGDQAWVQQVQANRLVVNWRKRDQPFADYPRFEGALQQFKKSWGDWSRFLVSVGVSAPRPVVWEAVYVNRIPRGGLWETPADWQKIFPGLWAAPFGSVAGALLIGLQGQWVWETTEPAARLYVEPKPGRGPGPEFQDLLFVTFTARGRLALPQKTAVSEHDDLDAIERGIRWGHGLIVDAFDSLNSAEAKTAWGRHDELSSHDLDH